jgi:uncharacterized protein
MIVADAGPIIIFAKIRRLSLLHDVTGRLMVPPAVHVEITVPGMPGAADLEHAEWIDVTNLADARAIEPLPAGLHRGEREAIALAVERSAQLLIDEIRGRRIAARLGVDVIGTLGILAEAKKQKLIEAIRPLVQTMQTHGYRFEVGLIRQFLERMDEH